MKKNLLFTMMFFMILLLCFSACSSPAASPADQANPAVETNIPLQVTSPTETPAPIPTATSAPSPTAVPEPIPCNIAFDSNRDGNKEVYRMAPDGSDIFNLTNNSGDDFDPAWSPDGSQVAFVSNRENGQEGGQFIYVMNADGSGVRQLTLENESISPDWSQDGSQITYSDKGDIYTIKVDGSEQSVNLTNSPSQDEQPVWSPDGSQIAWLSGNDGQWNIFVMNADGSHVLQLTDNGKVYDVTWTIDGQIFSHWDHPEGICSKCVMNPDGSNVKDAGGKGELQRYLPFWTLDGDRVECISADINKPDNEIYLVGEIFPDFFLNLTNNPADDRNPDWPANCALNRETSPEAVSASVTPSEIVLGYAGDDQWQPERKNDFKKACDELGIQCIYGEIPELIAQGANAIVQNSNSIAAAGLFPSIMEAKEKGVPVFILDAETNMDGAYNITIDHHVWAKTSLGWMLDKIGGKGQIAYFDLDPFNRYTDTIDDLLSRYPEISVVDKRDGKYDSSKIKPEFSDFVKNYPELKAVWTSYDNTQAIWGLEENGIPYENWPVIVCESTLDGLLAWEKIQKAYPEFDCIALANPSGIAYDAVYAAYDLVSGAQIDESALAGAYGRSLYVDIPIVTNENLQEWLQIMNKTNSYSVNQWMTPEEIRESWFVD